MLRLVVARYGEGDRLRWWNSSGVLSRMGAGVYTRGFPRTQAIARIRVIVATAAARCDELLPEPSAFHLFRLHPELEAMADEFVVSGNGTSLAAVDAVGASDPQLSVETAMSTIAGIDPTAFAPVTSLKVAAAARAVAVPPARDQETMVDLLAAGFVRSSVGTLIVPYTTVSK